jgi:hypothetical protein
VLFFFIDKEGKPFYQVFHKDTIVIDSSRLGFDLEKLGSIKEAFSIKNIISKSSNSTWEMPWGEQRNVENNYNEIFVLLSQKDPKLPTFNLILRAYDYGIGFRYDFPEQVGYDSLLIKEENTYFNLMGS